MPHLSFDIDHVGIRFDHDQAVANAGMIATATLADRLGIERSSMSGCRSGTAPAGNC